jgi:1-acyl-sn-glycerol-3-phosphate acyltransferase
MQFTKEEIESFKKKNPDKKHKDQYFHDEFPSFKRTELSSISFGWIFYGMLNYFWIKSVLSILTLATIYVCIMYNFSNKSISTKQDKETLFKIMSRLVSALLFGLGVKIKENDVLSDPHTIKVYRKYLGDDYDMHNSQFTTVISNHIGWQEIMYVLTKYVPSFTAKSSVLKIPMIGKIAQRINTIFIDRTNKESTSLVLQAIEERQHKILSGEELLPICLYPEGTSTNGKTIINFKIGAFKALTPIKPMFFKLDERIGKFPLSTGAMTTLLQVCLSLTFMRNEIEVYEMPVIKPTQYMYENFKNFGNEKCSIYLEVTRNIMSEVSRIPLSESTFNNKLCYISEIKRKIIKDT